MQIIVFKLVGWNGEEFRVFYVIRKYHLNWKESSIGQPSIIKAPSCIISSIKSILNKNFWGGCEDHRKTSLIGWKIASGLRFCILLNLKILTWYRKLNLSKPKTVKNCIRFERIQIILIQPHGFVRLAVYILFSNWINPQNVSETLIKLMSANLVLIEIQWKFLLNFLFFY